MTYKELKHKIREEQKSLAQEIKEQKLKRKDVPYGYVSGLDYNRSEFRHKHIAYCQFFNKTPYDMIETTCYEDPSKRRIENYMTSWESQVDEEALRDCA